MTEGQAVEKITCQLNGKWDGKKGGADEKEMEPLYREDLVLEGRECDGKRSTLIPPNATRGRAARMIRCLSDNKHRTEKASSANIHHLQ